MTARRDDYLARLDGHIRGLHAEHWHDEKVRASIVTGLLMARRMYLGQMVRPENRAQALADALAGPLLDPDEPLNLTADEAAIVAAMDDERYSDFEGLRPGLPLSDTGAEAEAASDSAECLAGLGWTVTRTVPPGDDGQCTASSWKASDGSHQPYGPGAFNRCTLENGPHAEHVDDFGNVFRFNPDAAGGQRDPRVKVLRHDLSLRGRFAS